MATIEQVYGNTWRIITRSMCIPFYRLNEKDIILMDSGFFHEGDEIEGALEEQGYEVKAILTTHVHYDHVGNHDRFRNKYGAQVYMTAFDAGISHTTLTLQACFYVNTVTELAEVYPFMVCSSDQVIPNGAQTVSVCGVEFGVLWLPGHAHEHIGYVTPDGVAYIGDLLIGEEDIRHMPMLFGQCWTEGLKSIDKICQTRYQAYILAHNGVYEDIQELAELNRRTILAQMDEVAALMEDWTLREDVNAAMVRRKVRRIHKERVRFVTRLVNASMNYLEDTGRLECEVREGKLYYRAVAGQEEKGQ